MVQAPQSFIVRQECEKAAWQHGFRRPMAAASEGWAAFASTTVSGTLSLAAAGDHGPWFLALDHGGVVEAKGSRLPAGFPHHSLEALQDGRHQAGRA